MNHGTQFFNNTPNLYLENSAISVVEGYIDKTSENHTHISPKTTIIHQQRVYMFSGFFFLTHEDLPPEYLYEYDNIFYYSKFIQQDNTMLSKLLGLDKIYGDNYTTDLMNFSDHISELRDIFVCYEEILKDILDFIFNTLFQVKESTILTMSCLHHFSKNFTYCNNNHKKQILICPAFIDSTAGNVLDIATLQDLFKDKREFIEKFKTNNNNLSDDRIYSNILKSIRENKNKIQDCYGEILYNRKEDKFFRLDDIEHDKKTPLLINRQINFGNDDNQNYIGCQEETSYVPSDCIKLGIFTDFAEHSILLLNMIKYFQLNTTFKLYEKGILKHDFRNRMLIPNIIRHITYYRNRMHIQIENYLDIRKVLGAHYTSDTNHLNEQRDKDFWESVPTLIYDIYFNYTQQYLSLIGHKVTQFVISTNSFFALPACDQHVLTQIKSCLMNKSNLSSLYFKLKLNNIVQYGANCLISENIKKHNIYSQCVLVLIGAMYLDAINLASIYNLLSELLFQDKSIQSKWLDLGSYYYNRNTIKLSNNIIKSYRKLETELGLVFYFKDLLLVAINGLATDPTLFEENYESFERLEFLGDAVLEFIVNIELILNQGIKDGDQIALKKTALTNNNHLCSVIEKLNIKEYYMASKHANVNFKSKRYADIFEALIGAIYVDKNLDTCYDFLKRNILNLDKDILKFKVDGIRRESKNDKNLLGDLITYYENLSKQKGKLEYRSKQVKDLDERFYYTEVYYNGVKCGEANGATKIMAEKNAAGISYDFVFQNRASLWDVDE